jgi:carbamate kinase
MSKLALVAIGGNSLLRAGERGTIAEQRANAALTAHHLVGLIQHGYHLVLTHGNGPQVGAQWLRSEIASAQVSPEPLDVCVADTEGSIGYILERALSDALSDARLAIPIATVITQVVVDAQDPAFQQPTKPVGPFYTADQVRRREQEFGWHMVEDAARGYRRVVPSPQPLEIVEIEALRGMIHDGFIVITAGGGGIPVVRRGGHLEGVEAVIDKDSASALLAHLLRIDTLMISTAVEQVYLHYQGPDRRAIARMTASEAQAYLDAGHFPPGSMGPKIAAAIGFLRAGGGRVIITTPERLLDAALGKAGTQIVPTL